MAKKVKTEGINAQLAIVIKSGKVFLGFKSVVKAIRNCKAKAIIYSNNLPIIRKSELMYLASLGNV